MSRIVIHHAFLTVGQRRRPGGVSRARGCEIERRRPRREAAHLAEAGSLSVLAPRMRQSTNWRGVAEPQVWFRIVHVATDGHHRALGTPYREQTVEIALGPKGAFRNGNVGAVTRQVTTGRVVSALPEPRGSPRPPKEPKTPRVVELLRKAHEWQGLIESGEVRNQAEIARREGITRARVTQVLGMLRLAPEIRQHILAMPRTAGRPTISERALRSVTKLDDERHQLRAFEEILSQ